MIRRHSALLAAALALAALAPAPAARAGGHVEIKATALPAKIEAGRDLPVSFAIAYPNGEPVTNARPTVIARCGSRRLEVAARPDRPPGRYVARVKLPRDGAWSFVVDSKICGNTCTLSPVLAVAPNVAKDATAAR